MTISATIGWALATLIGLLLWLRQQRRAKSHLLADMPRHVLATSAPATPKPSEALIYIEADGTARELAEDEKRYVDAEFLPFDGARPHIKARYDTRNSWGDLDGYLIRTELPVDAPIGPAPTTAPSPQTPATVARSFAELVRRSR